MIEQPRAYKNRIVGYGEEDPSQLLANPRNFRVHPANQQAALQGVLKRVGWVDSVIVNQNTGFVIDGHLRVADAISAGEPTIPVSYVDLSEEEEMLVLATFDQLTALAGRDQEQLDALIAGLNPDSYDPAVADLLRSLESSKEGVGTAEEDDTSLEIPEEPIVKLGDLWLMGEHRLLCGDSTNDADVSRLFKEGFPVACVWTDPPYGVDYDAKNDFLNQYGAGSQRRRVISGDQLGTAGITGLIARALGLAVQYCKPGATIYMACPIGDLVPSFFSGLAQGGFGLHQVLVWAKDSFVMGRSDYQPRHELVLYGWLPNGAHFFNGGRSQDTVFEVTRPRRSEEHPAIKPVGLIAPLIANSTRPGDRVYDPFVGSGSTLVAAIEMERLASVMEIDPRYAELVLRRYWAVTQDDPVRANDGAKYLDLVEARNRAPVAR